MANPVSYEAAVYMDDSLAIGQAILAAVLPHYAAIPDQRVRVCLVSAAMITVAQALDGSTVDNLDTMKREGIAHIMAKTLASKKAATD